MAVKPHNWKAGDVANGHILLEGEGWIPLAEHERRMREAQAQLRAPLAAEQPGPLLPNRIKAAWYKRTWTIAVAAGIVGLVIGTAGAGSGSTDPTASSEYKSLSSQLQSAKADLDTANAKIATVEGDLPDREATLKTGQAQLANDQKTLNQASANLKKAEADVAKREKAVGIVETTIANNTISGDGMYQVDKDIKAGTYKTTGKRGCYYAVLNSTDTFDIANNNNLDGPGYLTVGSGQYLELSGCANWVYQQ